MPHTRGSLSQLHDNVDREIFVMLNQQLKKLPPGWKEYFKVEQSSRMTEIAMNIVGFGDVPERDPIKKLRAMAKMAISRRRRRSRFFGIVLKENREGALRADLHAVGSPTLARCIVAVLPRHQV